MMNFVKFLLFIFISTNVSALIDQHVLTDLDDEGAKKQLHTLQPFFKYVEILQQTSDGVVTHLKFVNPNDNQVIAALYEKLLLVEITILTRVCYVYYSVAYDTNTQFRSTQKAQGCNRFANYLTFYNRNMITVAQYYDANSEGIKRLETKDIKIDEIVEWLTMQMDKLDLLNTIFTAYDTDFEAIFKKLTSLWSEEPAENGNDLLFSPRSDEQEQREFFNQIYEKILLFLAPSFLKLQNTFRSYFKQSPVDSVDYFIPPLETIDIFLSTHQPILFGIELKKSLTNISAVINFEREIFRIKTGEEAVDPKLKASYSIPRAI